MVIRSAKLSDIATLVSFQQALAQESEGIELDGEILEKGMRRMFEDATKGFYNVAEDEGKVIGCHMVTYEWSDWRNGVVWWIQSVFVIESYRGRGVFRLMYDLLREQVNQNLEIKGLRLYVDKSNVHAMKAYESVGMNGDHYTVYEWMKN